MKPVLVLRYHPPLVRLVLAMLVIGFLLLAKMHDTMRAFCSFMPLPRALRIMAQFYLAIRFIVLHVAARSIANLPERERLFRRMWFGRRVTDFSAPVQ